MINERMKQSKSRSMCSGCKDNFYNGHNDIGIDKCWSFDEAELVKVIQVGYWERPPYENKPIEIRLSCYRKRDVVYVKVPDQTTRKRKFTLMHW